MNTVFPKSVRVYFDEFGPHVPYAINLGALLRLPVEIFAPISERAQLVAGSLSDRAPHQLRALMHQRIAMHARTLQGDTAPAEIRTHIEDMRFGNNYILVSCATNEYTHVPTLSPAGETNVFRGTKGPIFVPLGDGRSGLVGAIHGICIAKQLDTSVVFWHTTWRNTAITEREPRAHITPNTAQVIANAEAHARESGVAYTTTCVCADDVVQGIIRGAQHAGGALVVMAQGGSKLSGTYTDRVRARNCPIPMLIIPREAQ